MGSQPPGPECNGPNRLDTTPGESIPSPVFATTTATEQTAGRFAPRQLDLHRGTTTFSHLLCKLTSTFTSPRHIRLEASPLCNLHATLPMDAPQTKAAEAQPGGQMDVVEDVEYGGKEVSNIPARNPDVTGPE